MYAFIVSNLSKETTAITVYNLHEEAVTAYEEYQELLGDDIFVLKISSGKAFGVNDLGSFGGEEILSNL
jgi:hypothetical protein